MKIRVELVILGLTLLALLLWLGIQPEIRSMWRPQTVAMVEVGKDDREADMDMGDTEDPPEEAVEFCINNREKFEQDFTTGGGEQGAYCRLLLKELPCDHDDCPDDPYEDVWDSEELPEITDNGI